MSKWTMDAPIAGMALAIASVGLEGMQRQDWDLGCFHSFQWVRVAVILALTYGSCEDLRDNI